MFVSDSGSGESPLSVSGNVCGDLRLDDNRVDFVQRSTYRIHQPRLASGDEQLMELDLTRRTRRLDLSHAQYDRLADVPLSSDTRD